MRFRKRLKLFPEVTLNFSKRGISTTIGAPGVSVNFNKQGTYLNVGIPGTGIYDRKKNNSNTQTKRVLHQQYFLSNQVEISTENIE